MATTPVYAFPYPIGTDRVMDGDNAIQALAERVEAVEGAWQAWTPTFAGFTVSSHLSRYRLQGKTVTGIVSCVLATGGGQMAFNFPVPPAVAWKDPAAAALEQIVGSVFGFNPAAAGTVYQGFALMDSVNDRFQFMGPGVPTLWGGTYPFAWAATSLLRVAFTYEAA